MKNLLSLAPLTTIATVVSAFLVVPISQVLAADSDSNAAAASPAAAAPAPTVAAPAPAPAADLATAKLPASVSGVVKLTKAQVNEDVILSYVQTSGASYSLSSDDIVRLRKEGVSDRVINAMLEQNKKAVQVAPAPASPAPTTAAVETPAPAQQAPPASGQPPVVEAPLTPSGSPGYAVPAPDAYYGPYPYYYGPYYYGGPAVTFGFRFGGGHGHHHWH